MEQEEMLKELLKDDLKIKAPENFTSLVMDKIETTEVETSPDFDIYLIAASIFIALLSSAITFYFFFPEILPQLISLLNSVQIKPELFHFGVFFTQVKDFLFANSLVSIILLSSLTLLVAERFVFKRNTDKAYLFI